MRGPEEGIGGQLIKSCTKINSRFIKLYYRTSHKPFGGMASDRGVLLGLGVYTQIYPNLIVL